jgi:hypothetical protein
MNDEDEVPSLKKVRKATAKSIATIGNKDHRLIENHSPEKARDVIEFIAMGGRIRDAVNKFEIDPKTIRRIHSDHRDVIGLFREYNAGEAFLLKQRTQALMHKKLDMMEDDEEQVKKTNLRDIAQAASMMGESYQNAIGEGANKAVTINVGPTFEDVQRHLAELRAKIKLEKNVTEPPIELT